MAIVSALNCPACEGEGVTGGVECATCDGTGEVEVSQDSSAMPGMPPTDTPGLPMSEAVREWDGQERRALATQDDPMSSALAEVTKQGADIMALVARGRELAEQYRNVAFDVSTTKGLEAAKKARLALREEARYPLQKLRDARSKVLGTMQRQANASADALIAEIEGYEKPIDEQITAEETRKENERKDREAAEQRRIDAHLSAIRAISSMATEAAGFDSAELVERIAAVEAVVAGDSYQEFQGQAQQAKDEALRQLQGMLVAARAEEAELEETRRQQAALAAAQQELEATRRAQAEQSRILAEREAALADKERQQQAEAQSMARAKQERADAVQRRIDGIRTCGPEPLDEAPSELIASAIRTLQACTLTEELLDARVAEAAEARVVRLHTLESAHAVAVEREAEEAATASAARIEELIANIRGMAENATLAVTDGSADVAQLRAGLEEVRDTDLSPEVFGERAEEAARVVAVAVSAIESAITVTEERDRLRAEEAEQRRQQEEADAVMRQRQLRLTAAAPRMFVAIKKALDECVDLIQTPAGIEFEAILAEIEGDKHA